MAKKNDLPSLHFYPGDWWKDPGVKMLTHEEKGVWFEMLLLMFDSKERGKLTMNGNAMTVEMISFALNLLPETATKIVSKLLAYDVCSVEPDTDIIYSRRMVRDEELSIIRKKSGKLGGIKKKENDLLRQNPTKIDTKALASPEDESEDENEVISKDYNIEELKNYLHAELPELGLDAPLVSSMQFDLIDSFVSECGVFQKLAIWKEYVERIKKSDWLMRRTTGKGQKKTKLSLKWLCKAESFTGVMAGNHDNVETVSDGREFI
jgi:hypothetical protein